MFEANVKRMENVMIENKMDFDKSMREADEMAHELIKLEQAKIEAAKVVVAAADEVAKVERLEKAKKYAQDVKKADKRVIIQAQKDVRRRRVRKEMAAFKKKFAKRWEIKKEDFAEKARKRIDAYCADEYNEMAIEMKFEKIKREFYAPPSRDNRFREEILTNHKNIVFLFLDAKLRKDGLTMTKVLYKFDKEKKGYLLYDEFKAMVKVLGVKLNPSQLSHVIRGVDADGDGCIDLQELLDSMKDIEHMGVVGSAWKMYIDPAQDVIVYHNFETEEKIFEYHMTDEVLKSVTISNVYGEADEEAKVLCETAKEEDWTLQMNTLMARRIQYMYRYWKCKKKRRAFQWKLKTRESNAKNAKAFYISSWCVKHWIGYKVRAKFTRELKLTYEKVFKADTGHMFWYNHYNESSHWERPYILWRYGDAQLPEDWVPIDVPKYSPEQLADPENEGLEQMYSLHYWHPKAQRDIPRKPDGLPLCINCNRNLATFNCLDCEHGSDNYCFTCMRETHASPFAFKQKSALSAEQRSKPSMLEKLQFSIKHKWRKVQYPRCKMCKTEKILAGMHCVQCNVDMCRACSRRIHERLPDHEVHAI